MQMEAFGKTDKGMVREHNEDSYLANEQDGIFLVADGMGGLSKGDIASRITVETIEHFITESRSHDITWPIKPQEQYTLEENRFLAAISLANWGVYDEFLRDGEMEAMGTTVVGLLVDGQKAVITNVGDSRGYLIRNNEIQQITDDHSLVMDEVRKGNMTMQEARNHPQKHVINRALGISHSTRVDISSIEIQAEDVFLLCSDGLSDMLSDDEMLSVARSNLEKPLQGIGEQLISTANNKGGKDNITVVLVRFH
jgi:serine/threonine protein phosphatase PrpC